MLDDVTIFLFLYFTTIDGNSHKHFGPQVYVWGRRNQHVNMSFLGLFNFNAPWLPWVLLLFSVMLGSSPVVDLLGMGAGHMYYFFEDVYPRISVRRCHFRPTFMLYDFLFPDLNFRGLTMFACQYTIQLSQIKCEHYPVVTCPGVVPWVDPPRKWLLAGHTLPKLHMVQPVANNKNTARKSHAIYSHTHLNAERKFVVIVKVLQRVARNKPWSFGNTISPQPYYYKVQ